MRHMEIAGAGRLLICLHGIGGSAATFTHQLSGLQSNFRVVARDAPGYGRSSDPPEYPGAQGYLDEIAEIITDEGRDSTLLLGMSWGGVIAMQFAMAYPALVAGLILGDTTRGSGQSERKAALMRDRPKELAELGSEIFSQNRARRLLGSVATDEDVAKVAADMAAAIRLPGYAHAARHMAECDLTGQLDSITSPTLILYGTEDVVTGESESAAIAAEISDSKVVPISGAGHLSNQEQPAAFNEAVSRFARTLNI